jgi:hypothetical protein
MSHLSSQPPEITAENLSQSPRSAGSAWAREKRFADVLGHRMAYIERGVGHPIVFLHGNPTSSFLWRGILPHVEASGRRLIAPDLIDIAVAARSAAVGRAGRCPRSDCRLLRMVENSAVAEALHRRGARCIHHGPNQETGEQLP